MEPIGWLGFELSGTPGVGVGAGELADVWPLVISFAWFFAGLLAVVVVGLYVVDPVIGRIVRRRNRNNPTIEEAISRYVRLLTVLVGVFVGAAAAGFGGFIASSTIVIAAATIAVGVAGQTVFGSLVSGIVLVGDPAFNVGNYIEWDEGEGVVESITLRVTRVVTPDGELVTIPNETLTSQEIVRPFGRGRYRVAEYVGIDYDDDVETAMDRLTAAAVEVDGVIDDPAPSAFVDELGEDAVIVLVTYWIDDPSRQDVFRIRSTWARTVLDSLPAAGITVSPSSKRELEGRIAVDEG